MALSIMSNTAQSAPLQGVTVLDLTRLLPGPACTLHLADLGANVIKIEDTQAGDYASHEVRQVVNRNKRAIRINLKSEAGVTILKRLVKQAHILVESFRPGVMGNLGVGYEELKQENPALIYCSITGYGQTGPMKDEPGHDINFCALSGVADQIGEASTGPALSNVPVGDLLGGSMMAVTGILAALFDTQRTQKGRYIDIAIADGALAHNMLPLALLNKTDQSPQIGQTALTGNLPCYGLYKTKDGRYIGMGAYEKKFWDRFCDLVNKPELKKQHTPASLSDAENTKTQLQHLFASHDFSWWRSTLENSGTCVTPILNLEETMVHPQIIARDMSLTFDDLHQLGCPIKMSGFQFSIRLNAPAQGEHTTEILQELGYTEKELKEYYQNDVIA